METCVKNEVTDLIATEMVTIKQEKEDDYEAMVLIEHGNELHNFTEDCKVTIKKDWQEIEQDPLSTNTEYSISADDMVIRENTVQDVLVKSEPVEEDNKNSDESGNGNNEDGGIFNSLLQDAKIEKFFKMWETLYPELHEQEQKNIYQENKGNIKLTMEKMRILNAERKLKSQESGQQNAKKHHSLDHNGLMQQSDALPQIHQSHLGPLPPILRSNEQLPTPYITESENSNKLTSTQDKKKLKSPTERKWGSRANQSAEAREKERERNRKPFLCVQCGERFIRKDFMLKHFQSHQENATGSSGDDSQPGSQALGYNGDNGWGRTWWSTSLAAKKNYKHHTSKCAGSHERKIQLDTNIVMGENTVEEANQNYERIGSDNNEDSGDDSLQQDAKTNKYLKMWKVLYSEVEVQEQRNIYQENNCSVRHTMEKIRLLNEERLRKKYPVIQAKIHANRKKRRHTLKKRKEVKAPYSINTGSCMQSEKVEYPHPSDIGHFVNAFKLSKEDKLRLLQYTWIPDKDYQFPSIADSTGQKRKFQPSYLEEFPWLSYSALPGSEGAFCRYCVIMETNKSERGNQELGVFVKRPFRHYKQAKERFSGIFVKRPFRHYKEAKGRFRAHQETLYHAFSMAVVKNFLAQEEKLHQKRPNLFL